MALQASVSGRGIPQARILEHIGQYWLPYPSRELYFQLPSPPTPEYLVLPEPLRPKQLHHLHTWTSQGQTQALQGSSGANPSGQPTCRGGNKTTVETQGQWWLRKKTQNPPTSYTAAD